MIRYFWATVWITLILGFSYSELILNFFIKNDVSFNTKIFEMHKKDSMMLANLGLVVLLMIDKFITQLITRRKYYITFVDIMLFFNILIATGITCIARQINESDLVEWFKLSYLFVLFVVILIVYKAESLKIKWLATDETLVPSKI